MIPYRSVHFIGVLSPEMASLAMFTSKIVQKVSGSDDHRDSIYWDPLEKAGIMLFDMFAQVNVARTTELVVLSPYYDMRHVEVIEAQHNTIQVMTTTEFKRLLIDGVPRLTVLDEYEAPLLASFIFTVLSEAHIKCNALTHTVSIDTEIPSLAAQTNESDIAVFPLSGFKRDVATYEAAFLSFQADTVVLPSIRYDYPELNTTLDDVYQSYYRFVKSVPRKGLILGNSDYSRMKRLRTHLADRHIETYGFSSDAMWRIKDVQKEENGTSFSLLHSNQTIGPFSIPFQGSIMLYNAVAAAVIGLLFDLRPEAVQRGLAKLPQFKRYHEVKQDKEGRIIIDDMADHPETIQAELENIRAQYPDKKIWCLYQPGSYLRTKALSEELQEALCLADVVYLADIKGYPKEKSEGLHIRHFIAALKQKHPQTFYIDSPEHMTGLLKDRVALNDCIVTFGVEGLCQEIVKPLFEDGTS